MKKMNERKPVMETNRNNRRGREENERKKKQELK